MFVPHRFQKIAFSVPLACCAPLLALSSRPVRAEETLLVSVQCKAHRYAVPFLNSQGYLAIPCATEDKDWVVEYRGEKYAATVVAQEPNYGLTFLKISLPTMSPFSLYAPRPAQASVQLKLIGRNETGETVSCDVSIKKVRRRISERDRFGTHYELNVIGTPPLPGALLTDIKSGEVHGMLTELKGDGGERYAMMGTDLTSRAAGEMIAIGAGAPAKGTPLVFENGNSVIPDSRNLAFLAASVERTKLMRSQSKQDFRKHSGFWVNSMTSPVISSDTCYFGSAAGMVYGINLNTLQRDWRCPNDYPVFFPPSVSDNLLVFGSGSLNLSALTERNTDLLPVAQAILRTQTDLPINLGGLVGMFTIVRTKRMVFDKGIITCVDKKSGVPKWDYETRFVSQPLIAGDKVVFAGLDTLGVLKLVDGKPYWKTEINHQRGDPTYYTLGGTDESHFWVLAMPTKVMGGTSDKGPQFDPLRLVQGGTTATVMRYSIEGGDKDSKGAIDGKKKKPDWTCSVRLDSDAPAFSGTIRLSEDHKIIYGADAKSAFAIDAVSGKMLWTKKVFAERFGGNLTTDEATLYATSSDNKLYALSATDGSLLWTFEGSKQPLCIPLAQGGLVYIGSLDTHIYTLNARTGKLYWTYEANGKVCGQPRILDKKLYCMTDDGNLTEITLPQ